MTRNINQPIAKKIGQYVKAARESLDFTQEDLAHELGVDDRTIRDWEAGRALPHLKNRKKLAELLSIPASILHLPEQEKYSIDQIHDQISKVKLSLDKGNFPMVLTTCKMLQPHIEKYASSKAIEGLEQQALLEYLIGHTISIIHNDPKQAKESFERMARDAHELKNTNFVVLGRTYQAEMYRRMKKPTQALRIIEETAVDASIDKMIRGNFFQLSGRLYTSIGQHKKAALAFREAQEMASSTARRTSDVYVCFNLCSVYEEQAKTCLSQLKLDRGMKYIELAEKSIPAQAPRWRIAVQLTKGELYIHEAALKSQKGTTNDANFVTGRKLIEAGFRLAHTAGHERQMSRAKELSKTFAKISTKSNDISNDLDVMFDTIELEEKSNIEDFK